MRLLQRPLRGESRHAAEGIQFFRPAKSQPAKYSMAQGNQPRLSGPSEPEKCRGQGAATQTVRMYGKEAATPPSAFSQARVSGPLFSSF